MWDKKTSYSSFTNHWNIVGFLISKSHRFQITAQLMAIPLHTCNIFSPERSDGLLITQVAVTSKSISP